MQIPIKNINVENALMATQNTPQIKEWLDIHPHIDIKNMDGYFSWAKCEGCNAKAGLRFDIVSLDSCTGELGFGSVERKFTDLGSVCYDCCTKLLTGVEIS